MKQRHTLLIPILLLAVAPATALTIDNEPTNDHTVYVGVDYEYDLDVAENEDNVTYSADNLPGWLNLNPDTGILSGDPDDNDQGSTAQLNITATNQSNSSDTASATYDVEVIGGLTLTEVEVNGDEVDDGDELDDELELDDEVEVVANVENNLEDMDADYLDPEDEDIDIEDVLMETTSDNLDPADNLEDEVDIDAGDDEDLTVSFTMDATEIDVDDAPFTVELDFEGEDDTGVDHTIDTFEFDIDLDVEDEDLRFVTGPFDSSQSKQLSCGQTSLRFDVEVRNVGEDDLDQPAIGFDGGRLGFDRVRTLEELDQGDSASINERFTIQDRPSPGEYFVDLIAYPDRTSSSRTDTDTMSVTVEDCSTQSNGGDDDEDDGSQDGTDDENNRGEDDDSSIDVGQDGSGNQAGPVGEPVVVQSGQQSSDVTNREYVYVLAGLVAILIVTVGAVLGKILG